MTDPLLSRYAAPQSDVADSSPHQVRSTKPPMALLLRWLLAITLVLMALWRLVRLGLNWRFYTDSMIIDPGYSPWPWLAVELCLLATGVLLAWRSRWVFVPLLLHVALFARQVFVALGGARIPGVAYEGWAIELLVFGFCAWLWLRRGLR